MHNKLLRLENLEQTLLSLIRKGNFTQLLALLESRTYIPEMDDQDSALLFNYLFKSPIHQDQTLLEILVEQWVILKEKARQIDDQWFLTKSRRQKAEEKIANQISNLELFITNNAEKKFSLLNTTTTTRLPKILIERTFNSDDILANRIQSIKKYLTFYNPRQKKHKYELDKKFIKLVGQGNFKKAVELLKANIFDDHLEFYMYKPKNNNASLILDYELFQKAKSPITVFNFLLNQYKTCCITLKKLRTGQGWFLTSTRRQKAIQQLMLKTQDYLVILKSLENETAIENRLTKNTLRFRELSSERTPVTKKHIIESLANIPLDTNSEILAVEIGDLQAGKGWFLTTTRRQRAIQKRQDKYQDLKKPGLIGEKDNYEPEKIAPFTTQLQDAFPEEIKLTPPPKKQDIGDSYTIQKTVFINHEVEHEVDSEDQRNIDTNLDIAQTTLLSLTMHRRTQVVKDSSKAYQFSGKGTGSKQARYTNRHTGVQENMAGYMWNPDKNWYRTIHDHLKTKHALQQVLFLVSDDADIVVRKAAEGHYNLECLYSKEFEQENMPLGFYLEKTDIHDGAIQYTLRFSESYKAKQLEDKDSSTIIFTPDITSNHNEPASVNDRLKFGESLKKHPLEQMVSMYENEISKKLPTQIQTLVSGTSNDAKAYIAFFLYTEDASMQSVATPESVKKICAICDLEKELTKKNIRLPDFTQFIKAYTSGHDYSALYPNFIKWIELLFLSRNPTLQLKIMNEELELIRSEYYVGYRRALQQGYQVISTRMGSLRIAPRQPHPDDNQDVDSFYDAIDNALPLNPSRDALTPQTIKMIRKAIHPSMKDDNDGIREKELAVVRHVIELYVRMAALYVSNYEDAIKFLETTLGQCYRDVTYYIQDEKPTDQQKQLIKKNAAVVFYPIGDERRIVISHGGFRYFCDSKTLRECHHFSGFQKDEEFLRAHILSSEEPIIDPSTRTQVEEIANRYDAPNKRAVCIERLCDNREYLTQFAKTLQEYIQGNGFDIVPFDPMHRTDTGLIENTDTGLIENNDIVSGSTHNSMLYLPEDITSFLSQITADTHKVSYIEELLTSINGHAESLSQNTPQDLVSTIQNCGTQDRSLLIAVIREMIWRLSNGKQWLRLEQVVAILLGILDEPSLFQIDTGEGKSIIIIIIAIMRIKMNPSTPVVILTHTTGAADELLKQILVFSIHFNFTVNTNQFKNPNIAIMAVEDAVLDTLRTQTKRKEATQAIAMKPTAIIDEADQIMIDNAAHSRMERTTTLKDYNVNHSDFISFLTLIYQKFLKNSTLQEIKDTLKEQYSDNSYFSWLANYGAQYHRTIEYWLRAAEEASRKKLDHHYTISNGQVKIVAVDTTGARDEKSIWGEGLHQMICIKEINEHQYTLQVPPDTFPQISSDILTHIMEKYGNVVALTGTVGPANTRKFLLNIMSGQESQFYFFPRAKRPEKSSQPKYPHLKIRQTCMFWRQHPNPHNPQSTIPYYNQRIDYQPIFYKDSDTHKVDILKLLIKLQRSGRSTLVCFHSIAKCTVFYNWIQQNSSVIDTTKVYVFDEGGTEITWRLPEVVVKGKTSEPGTIIITTNIGGRAIDFTGLTTVVKTVLLSPRQEKQIEGRCGRGGGPSETYHLIYSPHTPNRASHLFRVPPDVICHDPNQYLRSILPNETAKMDTLQLDLMTAAQSNAEETAAINKKTAAINDEEDRAASFKIS